MSTLPAFFPSPILLWQHPALAGNPVKRSIIEVIAGFAYGDRAIAWPSNKTIAGLVGRSVGHVRRLIGEIAREAPELLSRRPCEENGTGRLFELPWKVPIPKECDGRSPSVRAGNRPPARRQPPPLRAGVAPNGLKGERERNAVGVLPQEGGTPPAETEQEPPTPQAVRDAIAAGVALARVAPPVAEITPQASLRKAGPSPESLARVVAELEAHKLARIAREAPQATASPAPAPEAPSAAPAPRGWAATLAKVFRG